MRHRSGNPHGSVRSILVALSLGLAGGGVGCQQPAHGPPFEWWADPLPAPPAVSVSKGVPRFVILVEYTGRRDDYGQFLSGVSSQHRRVKRREIPGFQATCHYMPNLAVRTSADLIEGINSSGRFMACPTKEVDKALKQHGMKWADMRAPAAGAWFGRQVGANYVLLVDVVDCSVHVTEAGPQASGARKSGAVRRVDISVRYHIRLVDVAGEREIWTSDLPRRWGYKLEGFDRMGHWYHPWDPMESWQALRGQGLGEYVLGALSGGAGAPGGAPDSVNPSAPWRQP
jgi:hypothetical protein